MGKFNTFALPRLIHVIFISGFGRHCSGPFLRIDPGSCSKVELHQQSQEGENVSVQFQQSICNTSCSNTIPAKGTCVITEACVWGNCNIHLLQDLPASFETAFPANTSLPGVSSHQQAVPLQDLTSPKIRASSASEVYAILSLCVGLQRHSPLNLSMILGKRGPKQL